MDAKKFALGTVAGGVAYFLLGWLIYGVALAKFFDDNSGSATGVMKETPDFLWLIIGNLAWGALLTWIFLRWAGIKTFGAGAQAGLVLGLLMTLAFDSMMYATSNVMNMTGMLTDVVVGTVMSAVAGGVVGAVLGMGKS